MIRQYLILLPALLLFSCAGRSTETLSQEPIPYQEFSRLSTEGPVIPGLDQALVPQGMAYWPEADLIIISNYMSDGTAGALSIINMDDGKLHKILYLYNDVELPHTGHLGGLALAPDYLWIASGSGVYFLSLETIKMAEDGSRVLLSGLIETETKGSFATYNDGILWIGEFTRADGSYPARKTHQATATDGKLRRGWLGGYKLNSETGMIIMEDSTLVSLTPDFILSVPDEIQGAVFFDDMILLSASYGRRNDSRLLLHNNPLAEPSHSQQDFLTGMTVPLWFLDDNSEIGEIIIPPMSEALVEYDGSIAVLFESAASKYRSTAKNPLDRLQFIDLDGFSR